MVRIRILWLRHFVHGCLQCWIWKSHVYFLFGDTHMTSTIAISQNISKSSKRRKPLKVCKNTLMYYGIATKILHRSNSWMELHYSMTENIHFKVSDFLPRNQRKKIWSWKFSLTKYWNNSQIRVYMQEKTYNSVYNSFSYREKTDLSHELILMPVFNVPLKPAKIKDIKSFL